MKPATAIFINKEGMATFWFLLAAGVALGSGIYTLRLLTTAGLRPQYIIMTHPDVVSVVADADPLKEEEMQTEQTRLAMDSIFNKSPNGLDAADRCRKLLSPEAWQWVQTELVDKQADAFRDARMHQKVEIGRIELRKAPGHEGVTFAAVQGQLVRTGVTMVKSNGALVGQIFNEVWNVRAEFMWTHNPSLRMSGRQPMICSKFKCQESPVASTLHRTLGEDAPTTPTPDAAAAPEAAPQ